MIFIKHVRNKIKSYYEKSEKCYICGADKDLEFHHLLCLSVAVKKLLRKEGYNDYPKDDDPRFEELVWKIARDPEIMNPECFYTLCKPHHKQLHSIYGQNYINWKPVKMWLDKMRVANDT